MSAAGTDATGTLPSIVPPTCIVTDNAPEDTYALAGQGEYPQTEEQRLETRNVEEYLRRMSQRERLNRRSRLDAQNANASTSNGSSSLMRRLSSSIARVPSLRSARHTHQPGAKAGAYEMTQSNYGQSPRRDTPHMPQGYGPITDESEESQFMSVNIPDATESRQELNDHTPLHTDPYASTGDVSAISMEDLGESQRPFESDTPTSPPDPYQYAPGTETALARLRSQNFPSVTVGKASNRQMQRQASMSRQTSSSAARHHTRSPIESIPEGDIDVTMVPSQMSGMHPTKDDPFQTPPYSGSLSRSSCTDLHELPLQSQTYPSAALMTTHSFRNEDTNAVDRWYWSDLLLGCGLCKTTNDEDEQAARTNPME